jgi:hypothetical protein
VTIDERRWTYEQVAKQIEREDNLHHARLSACIVVNLALLAAVATQINLPGLGLKNLVIILGCSAAGYVITRGIRSTIADGDIQLDYLRRFFWTLDKKWESEDEPCSRVRPFMSEDRPAAKEVAKPWTSIIRLFKRIRSGDNDVAKPWTSITRVAKRIWSSRGGVAYSWTSITLVFQLMWVAIPILALLVFLFPDIIA